LARNDSQYTVQREALKRVLEDLKAGKQAPVYLLHGDEPQFLRAASARILELLLPAEQRATNLTVLDGNDPESYTEANLTTALSGGTLGFFDEGVQVVLVKNPPVSARRSKDDEAFAEAVKSALAAAENPESADWKAVRAAIQKARAAAPAFGKALEAAVEEFRRTHVTPDLSAEVNEAGASEEKMLSEAELRAFAELCSKPEVLEGFSAAAAVRLHPLEEFCANPVEGKRLIIYSETKLKANSTLIKAVQAAGGVVLSLNKLQSGEDLTTFVSSLFKRFKKRLTPEAAAELEVRCGRKAAELQQAAQVLALYTGEKRLIEAEDVRQVVADSVEVSVFELTDALGERNLAKALHLLQQMLDARTEPWLIFSLLVRQFRLLAQARLLLDESGVRVGKGKTYYQVRQRVLPQLKAYAERLPDNSKLNLLKQHDFVVYKSLMQAQRFSTAQALASLQFLHTLEFQLKTEGSQKAGLQRALEGAVIRLAKGEFASKTKVIS